MRGTATLFARSEGAGDKLCRDEGLTGGPLISLQSERPVYMRAFVYEGHIGRGSERLREVQKKDKEEGCDILNRPGRNKCGGHTGEQRR